jgi:alcohol dehydrogenase
LGKPLYPRKKAVLSDRRLDISFSGRTVFGQGAASRVADLLKELGAARSFIVTDPGVLASGVADVIRQPLEVAGVEVATFDAVKANPTISDVQAGGAALRDFGAHDTIVVAVGGGSAMDAAKAIALHAVNGGSVDELDFRREPEHPGLPLIAVPTTAGTGSETNSYGVITNILTERKFYIGDSSVKPKVSVLDPELTLGLPPAATAATGLDALTHALESLMSRNANPYAEGLALQVIRMVAAWLPAAVQDGDDLEARSQMLFAAHLAGLAFSSGTGLGLCHAIAHPLGARLGMVHGAALAAVLPLVMMFNLPTSERKLELAGLAFGVAAPAGSPEQNARAAIAATERFVSNVMDANSPTSLELPKEMLPTIVEDALEDIVMANTPRLPSAREVEDILISAS